MIIRSTRPESNFYLLDKRISEDKKLSWASRGLLIFLLGKPDNWRVSAEFLAQQTTESSKKTGKQGVYSLLDELIVAGYVIRSDKQAHDEKTGFLLGYDYVVYDSPCHPKPYKAEPYKAEPYKAEPYKAEPYKAEPYKAEPYKAEPYKANHPLISTELEQGLNLTSIDINQGLNGSNGAVAQKPNKLGLKDLISLGVTEQIAKDWLEVRKMKRAPLTQTALDAIIKEAAKARLTLNDAIKSCVENSWQGFKADWYLNVNKSSNGNRPKLPSQMTEAERKAAHDEMTREAKRMVFGDDDFIDGVASHV
jgi:hypothetical protein